MSNYRDTIKGVLDELEKDIGETRDDLNNAFTKVAKLCFLLGEDEYDTELACALADEIKDLLDDSIEGLTIIENKLY